MHFLFAYIDYRQLLAKTAAISKKDGLISICTTTGNSFQQLRTAGTTKIARFVCRLFNVKPTEILDQYAALMPNNSACLQNAVQEAGYDVLSHDIHHLRISVATWREAWDFMHNAGWFVEALHRYQLSKYKIAIMFTIAKFTGLLPLTKGRIEDTMEFVVLTAKRR